MITRILHLWSFHANFTRQRLDVKWPTHVRSSIYTINKYLSILMLIFSTDATSVLKLSIRQGSELNILLSVDKGLQRKKSCCLIGSGYDKHTRRANVKLGLCNLTIFILRSVVAQTVKIPHAISDDSDQTAPQTEIQHMSGQQQ